ncbi:MAG TPA: hypothetical protein VFQ38_12440 [Longimicrobiales bacterium]|nr:hypothetical protein [Longimicrobiales bacterium]
MAEPERNSAPPPADRARARIATRARSVVGLVAAAGSAACFRYVPVQPAAVRPTEDVRVALSDSAAVRLVSELGAYTGELEGRLAPQHGDSLSLSILIGREYRGVALDQVRQTLFLGRGEVVAVQRREFSRGRTALVLGGVLAGFVAMAQAIHVLGDPNGPSEGGPPPPPPPSPLMIRIPLGR